MIDTWTYDDLALRLKKSTKLILLSDYIKPEWLTKRGTLIKTMKDAHVQAVYNAFEAFMMIYGESVKQHNEWVYSKSDAVIFSSIKL